MMSKLSNHLKYLDEETYIDYAYLHYHSKSFTLEQEFEDDVKRFEYIKRLILKWLRRSPKSNHRLLTNHLIISCNSFGIYQSINLLRFFCDTQQELDVALTILAHIGFIDDIHSFNIDFELVKKLREDDSPK